MTSHFRSYLIAYLFGAGILLMGIFCTIYASEANDDTFTPSQHTSIASDSTPNPSPTDTPMQTASPSASPSPTASPIPLFSTDPFSIVWMSKQLYPGSPIRIEHILPDHPTYHSFVVSYLSTGLKIYAMFTLPKGTKPVEGWPAILMNHGYIAPGDYRTTQSYSAHVDGFASAGFAVLMPDLRGDGTSEGTSQIAYSLPDDTIDSMNALSSLRDFSDVDRNEIGVWGHSMGGNVTLRELVISPNIKAAVIWSGVIGSYEDLVNYWQSPPNQPLQNIDPGLANLVAIHGNPRSTSAYWNAVDPIDHLDNITAPIQLHVGLADNLASPDFSAHLRNLLRAEKKTVQYFEYPGGNHELSGSDFNLAVSRSVDFFTQYLKHTH